MNLRRKFYLWMLVRCIRGLGGKAHWSEKGEIIDGLIVKADTEDGKELVMGECKK